MNHGRFTRHGFGTAGTPHWCATCGHHLGWGSQGWSWNVVQKMSFPAQQLGWLYGGFMDVYGFFLWVLMGFYVFFMGFNDHCFFLGLFMWCLHGPCMDHAKKDSEVCCLERVGPIDLESLKLFGTKKQGVGLTWIYVWAKRSDSLTIEGIILLSPKLQEISGNFQFSHPQRINYSMHSLEFSKLWYLVVHHS